MGCSGSFLGSVLMDFIQLKLSRVSLSKLNRMPRLMPEVFFYVLSFTLNGNTNG